MVTQERDSKQPAWKCPYCNKEFAFYSDAEECARDCADIDSPNMIDGLKNTWCCDICKNEYSDEHGTYNRADAQECEDRHIEAQDLFLGQYQFEQNRTILDVAAQHSEQRKLNV